MKIMEFPQAVWRKRNPIDNIGARLRKEGKPVYVTGVINAKGVKVWRIVHEN